MPSANHQCVEGRELFLGQMPIARRPSTSFGIVWSESQLATETARSPCRRSTGTSLGMPRMVLVIGATVTAARMAIAPVRVTRRTGRRPIGGGSRAQ